MNFFVRDQKDIDIGEVEFRATIDEANLFVKNDFSSFFANLLLAFTIFLNSIFFVLLCLKDKARVYDINDLSPGGMAILYLSKGNRMVHLTVRSERKES